MKREEADNVTTRKNKEAMEKMRTEMERNNEMMEGVARRQADMAATEKVYMALQYTQKDSDTYDALVKRLLKYYLLFAQSAEDGARYKKNRSGISAEEDGNKSHGEDEENIVNNQPEALKENESRKGQDKRKTSENGEKEVHFLCEHYSTNQKLYRSEAGYMVTPKTDTDEAELSDIGKVANTQQMK